MPTIRRTVKFAPCGRCRAEVCRDDMFSLNVKVFTPTDDETKIQIRVCEPCHDSIVGELRTMEWDNESMVARQVDVDEDAA